MESSLRQRFARLGPIRAIDRVISGSPAMFVVRTAIDGPRARTIDAIHALARRGMTMLRAKRAVESLLEKGRVFVEPPMVEDVAGLGKAGFAAVQIQPDPMLNVREQLQLTR